MTLKHKELQYQNTENPRRPAETHGDDPPIELLALCSIIIIGFDVGDAGCTTRNIGGKATRWAVGKERKRVC